MSTMLAAVFEGNGVLNVKEVPKPQIMHPDDVLIKVGAASICGSDLHVLHVPPAIIVRNELTVMGTYCAHHTFPISIKLLQNPELGLEKIISHKVELKDIKHGIELLNSQQASRVIVYPNGID